MPIITNNICKYYNHTALPIKQYRNYRTMINKVNIKEYYGEELREGGRG